MRLHQTTQAWADFGKAWRWQKAMVRCHSAGRIRYDASPRRGFGPLYDRLRGRGVIVIGAEPIYDIYISILHFFDVGMRWHG
ncbi:hypothetical protein D1012_05490 [Pseudotabrizicola alkalilacus]|uniref:Uncharacterized protein n=1 Tax=Pseudotabrizicola alkalilacus TaxID=2305252 RepID=A0A411Z5E1_9RHOB|nr:hypothetical protein D1012_05490 [Pseudotabrizicola alkalilacus]